MRRSKEVHLTLLATLALAVTTGCEGPAQRRDCVDAQNHIVPDKFCDDAQNQNPDRNRPGFPYVPFMAYRYLYGGSSGGHFGDTVFNGATMPTPGARVFSGETGVSRGGFGRGGGGGEGGEGGGHAGGSGE